jgi:hypothetical protein
MTSSSEKFSTPKVSAKLLVSKTGVYVIKLLMAIIYECPQLATAFV